MPGLALAQFLDTMINTGPVFLSGQDSIINSVSRRSFIIGKFLKSSAASVVLQGGDTIQETLYLQAVSTHQSVKRNEDIVWQNPQKDVLASIPWRFGLDHMSFDEVEYLVQSKNTTYKDMAYSKQQRMWDSMIDGEESKLWQPPGTTTSDAAMFNEMEGANGGEMYSIPVFVHENAGSNGRFTSGWTTIEGINPASYTQRDGSTLSWDNKRATYDATDPLDNDTDGDGLFDAFDDISIEIGYDTPGFKDKYFEPSSAYDGDPNQVHPNIIATSKRGKKQIMRAHRLSNDSLITPQDAAYPKPRWNDMPIQDVAALDSASLYVGAGNAMFHEAHASVTKSGARYYFLNCRYLKMVYHSAKYFVMRAKKELEAKVGVFVVPVEVYRNLVCTGRRWQGLVSPA